MSNSPFVRFPQIVIRDFTRQDTVNRVLKCTVRAPGVGCLHSRPPSLQEEVQCNHHNLSRTRTRRYRDPIDGQLSAWLVRSRRSRIPLSVGPYLTVNAGMGRLRHSRCAEFQQAKTIAAQSSRTKQSFSRERVSPGNGQVIDPARRLRSTWVTKRRLGPFSLRVKMAMRSTSAVSSSLQAESSLTPYVPVVVSQPKKHSGYGRSTGKAVVREGKGRCPLS